MYWHNKYERREQHVNAPYSTVACLLGSIHTWSRIPWLARLQGIPLATLMHQVHCCSKVQWWPLLALLGWNSSMKILVWYIVDTSPKSHCGSPLLDWWNSRSPQVTLCHFNWDRQQFIQDYHVVRGFHHLLIPRDLCNKISGVLQIWSDGHLHAQGADIVKLFKKLFNMPNI